MTFLITGEQTYRKIDDRIANIVLQQNKHTLPWYIVFGIGFGLLQLMGLSITWLLYRGVGVWGINKPVMWGWDIINFVWWIGIGHAGTLISAILLLLRQQWRNSINRFAEADDAVCRCVRRTFSPAAHRTALGSLLDVPIPEHFGNVAAVPQPAALGRVCRFDLCDGFRSFLGRGPYSRPCHPAR